MVWKQFGEWISQDLERTVGQKRLCREASLDSKRVAPLACDPSAARPYGVVVDGDWRVPGGALNTPTLAGVFLRSIHLVGLPHT